MQRVIIIPNFRTHILSGIVAYPFFYILFATISSLIFSNIYYFSADEIAFSFSLFVLGSDLPDVDHQHALINKFFRILLIIATIYYVFLYSYNLYPKIPFSRDVSNFLLLIVAISLGALISVLFNKLTRHRGIWHTVFMALILSGALFLLNLKYTLLIQIFYSLSLFFGYCVHLFLDKYFKENKK
jgi:uncharacterized membrane protein YoaK (UPF0700 family)